MNHLHCVLQKQVSILDSKLPGWVNKGRDWDSEIVKLVGDLIEGSDRQWFYDSKLEEESIKTSLVELIVLASVKYHEQGCRLTTKEIITSSAAKVSQKLHHGRAYYESKGDESVIHLLKRVVLGALSNNNNMLITALGTLTSQFHLSILDVKKLYMAATLLDEYRHLRLDRYLDPDMVQFIEGKEDTIWFREIVDKILTENEEMEHEELKTVSFIMMDSIFKRELKSA